MIHSSPIVVLSGTAAGGGYWSYDGVTPDGRTVSATVARWQTTADGIAAALEEAWQRLLEADETRRMALLSFEQELRDYGPLDYPDVDPGAL